MFQGVTVWLDDQAPRGGSFGQALTWAERLQLPLQGIFLAGSNACPALLDACAAHCRKCEVPWNALVCEDRPSLAAGDLIRGGDLCVFSQALSPRYWDVLLQWTLSSPEAIALVCPREPVPLGRPLIVNEGDYSANAFLLGAARLCKALGADPVVLTVAPYEGEAIRRERDAETVFRKQGVLAEFDSMACADNRRAVALAARCRGCSHIFVERRQAAPWWRWLHRDTLHRLLGLCMPLTYLTYSALPPPEPTDGTTSALERPRMRSLLPGTKQ